MAVVCGAERESVKHSICACIDENKEKLSDLSQAIWSRAELAYKEQQSHDLLVRFFSEVGDWTVEPNYVLETAFRASWCNGDVETVKPVKVCFLCEYDALPSLGHACGHNLIAEVGAAAALGLKEALQRHTDTPAQITVLGTPAEEDGGGKIDLIKAGAFEDIDVVFMAHPSHEDKAFHPCTAIIDCTVKYHGKAAHAAAFPWEGANALDAAVLAYSSLSALRQQLRPEWRLHGIIKHGGTKPNIIPDYTEMEYYIRTPLLKDLSDLRKKVEACFRSAALATGCQVEMTFANTAYSNILQNTILEKLYEDNGRSLGMEFKASGSNFSDGLQSVIVELQSAPVNSRAETTDSSTDFGNVSCIVPGIHPFFYIGTKALNHTPEYATAAGSGKAQMYSLRTAKALAMTAADVLLTPALLEQVKEEFILAKQTQE